MTRVPGVGFEHCRNNVANLWEGSVTGFATFGREIRAHDPANNTICLTGVATGTTRLLTGTTRPFLKQSTVTVL